MAYLGDKAVGTVVKIKENGVAVNYIIIHKGKPSTLYDSSCNGVWVLRETPCPAVTWAPDGKNDYEKSNVKAWLDSTFLNTINSEIRTLIKSVKIPFKKGLGTDTSTQVMSGSNGLSCKVFLLSGYELGLTVEDDEDRPVDGAKLSYFSDNNSRIAKDSSGSAVSWWARSPSLNYSFQSWYVGTGGFVGTNSVQWTTPLIRPAFILPTNLVLTADGIVTTNNIPTITSDKTGNLGTLTSGFVCRYSVNDVDSTDSVKVTVKLDSTTIRTFTATKGAQYSYSLTGTDWLKITNGTHTFKITATDGKNSVTSTATFTRACKKATVTMTSALAADDIIRFCLLKVKGALPTDTILKCEVTNNANDAAPVWEDCTARVKSESTYVFKNKTAAKGFAFNFRISAERGSSGAGGYITTVCGGFE